MVGNSAVTLWLTFPVNRHRNGPALERVPASRHAWIGQSAAHQAGSDSSNAHAAWSASRFTLNPNHSPRIERDAIWPNSRLVGQVAFRFQPAIAGFRMNWNVKCLESGVFEQLRLLRLERYGQVTDNQTLQAQRRQEGPGGCGEATLLRKARSKGSSDRSLIGSSRSRKHSHRPEPAT